SGELPAWTAALGGSLRLTETKRVVGVTLPAPLSRWTAWRTSAASSGSSGWRTVVMARPPEGVEEMGSVYRVGRLVSGLGRLSGPSRPLIHPPAQGLGGRERASARARGGAARDLAALVRATRGAAPGTHAGGPDPRRGSFPATRPAVFCPSPASWN